MIKSINPCHALLLAVLFSTNAFSQKDRPDMKFGNVKPADFLPQAYAIDSSASAIFLIDQGATHYNGNNEGGFDVVFETHEKIRLLKKTSFEDVATVKIQLVKTNDYEEKLDDLEAATFNLENGQVVKTKLEKSSIFKDKDGDYITVKFTFPNIKEGSIIEYKYKHITPAFWRIPAWTFQGVYPRLWSEYSVEIPEFYDFVFLQQGYLPFHIDSVKTSHDNFNITSHGSSADSRLSTYSFGANTVQHFWVVKDAVPLKDESFTTTLQNHVSKIEFQLSSIRYPERPVEPYLRDWYKVSEDLMKDEDFGEVLSHDNNWLKDDVKKAVDNEKDPLEKAKKIFAYVRDNFSCNDYSYRYLSQTPKKTLQLKKGNVVDINMLLAAMLQYAGFEVHPVLLSTRKHGKTLDVYPIMTKFNYMITQAVIGDKSYLLDAASGDVAFGKLPVRCYNGSARIIEATNPALINLSADSLKESRITAVFIVNDEKGLAGSYASTFGHAGSIDLRDELHTDENKKDFYNKEKKEFPFEVEMTDAVVDSLKLMDNPVAFKYTFKFKPEDDMLYLNPLLTETTKENPFKSAERIYPVEMPYCVDEVYLLNMEIPKGYKVEEVPKSSRVMLNETDGMFEYIIAASGDHIQLRCRLNIKKANFTPDDYQTLRDFYAFVVKKEAEQIVFKKM